MTPEEAKTEVRRIWMLWPPEHRGEGTEALREALAPYRSVRHVPSAELAAFVDLFRMRTEAALVRSETSYTGKLRIELSLVLDAIHAAPWYEQEGERVKRICFARAAIERIRTLLAK